MDGKASKLHNGNKIDLSQQLGQEHAGAGSIQDIADRFRSKHMRRLLEEHEYVLYEWGVIL